jgi:hypothetical protein
VFQAKALTALESELATLSRNETNTLRKVICRVGDEAAHFEVTFAVFFEHAQFFMSIEGGEYQACPWLLIQLLGNPWRLSQ